MAPYTTDGDLGIDPSELAAQPALEQLLQAAGFRRAKAATVGTWITTRYTSSQQPLTVGVDLLVPASVSPGKGRRAAHLTGHDAHAARIVRGLEGALVDHDTLNLSALAEGDGRRLDVRVAGSAALLVAKVHKISDRERNDRLSDKDALDVLRLLRGTTTVELAARYLRLLEDPRSREVSASGRDLLRSQFSARRSVGIEMAIRAAGVLIDADEIAASLQALVGDLLSAVDNEP